MSRCTVETTSFGQTRSGESVDAWRFAFPNGFAATVLTWGGVIQSLEVPCPKGRVVDVVGGYDRLEDYEAESPYFGAIIGRYGNRIGGDGFRIGTKFYPLAKNGGDRPELMRHLHGGAVGFSHRVWRAELAVDREGNPVGLDLSRTSPDGEEGYPGNLSVTCAYRFSGDGVFSIRYRAETDAPTHVNLTHHSYFNLDGHDAGSILEHAVEIIADRFVVIDEAGVPTGEIRAVEGTPFDFRKAKTIGRDLAVGDEQLILPKGGYDHTYVLGDSRGSLRRVAEAEGPLSGRRMEVWTDQPGVQFYIGNSLDNCKSPGKAGKLYRKHDLFCFEAQHFPDSPNRPEFPSTLLEPGMLYETVTEYRFK